MIPAGIAAHMMDPRYKGVFFECHMITRFKTNLGHFLGQNLKEAEKEKGLEWLAAKNPALLIVYHELQKPDSNYFFKPYNNKAIISKMQPRDWWKSASKDAVTPIVHEIVDELLSLPAGTANMERNFSTLGSIITKQRNRLNVEKASKLCSIINHYKIMRKI